MVGNLYSLLPARKFSAMQYNIIPYASFIHKLGCVTLKGFWKKKVTST